MFLVSPQPESQARLHRSQHRRQRTYHGGRRERIAASEYFASDDAPQGKIVRRACADPLEHEYASGLFRVRLKPGTGIEMGQRHTDATETKGVAPSGPMKFLVIRKPRMGTVGRRWIGANP